MNREKLAKAIGEIDSRYLEEAIHYSGAKGKKRRPGRWLRLGMAAACLCAVLAAGAFILFSPADVVTTSGFFTVTACAASSDEELVMEEGIPLPTDFCWCLAMSSQPGLPLQLNAAGHPEAVFSVSVEGGSLLLWENDQITTVESPFAAEDGTTIYWNCLMPAGEDRFAEYTGETAYVRFVIREAGHIVGYAVIQIYTDSPENEAIPLYCAKLLKSISFPQVNGEYQKIAEQYVSGKMDQIISEAEATRDSRQ